MPVKLGEWKREWERMKDKFQKETDKKKPSDKFAGVRKKSGVASAFDKMDKTYKALAEAKPADKPKRLDAFVGATRDAAKEVEDYCGTLDRAAAKEAEGTTMKAMIQLLKKDAKACLTQAQGQVELYVTALKADGQIDAKLVRQVNVLKKLMAGTLKNATLFIAEVAKDKSVDNFRSGILKAARDVSQNFKNLEKHFKEHNADEARKMRGPLVLLEAWADKGRNLEADATEADLMRELKEFHGVIKQSGAWLKQAPAR